MPGAAASLFLVCALNAQTPSPLGPVRSVSLKVEVPDSDRSAVSLEAKQIQEDLTAFFLRHGIPVLPEEAAAEGAYTLEVAPLTVRYSEGTCLLSVSERLLPRSGTKGEPKGANYMAAQAGEEGFCYEARQTILDMAAHLLGQARGGAAPALQAPAPAVPADGSAAQRPPAPRPRIVDVDFSKVKVKTQPPAPRYPLAARQRGIDGTVVVQVTVDPEGRPQRGIVTSGPALLKATALRYAMQWLFEPAQVNGEPQWASFRLTMPFHLRDWAPPPDRTFGQKRVR
jgi:TonB family protein